MPEMTFRQAFRMKFSPMDVDQAVSRPKNT